MRVPPHAVTATWGNTHVTISFRVLSFSPAGLRRNTFARSPECCYSHLGERPRAYSAWLIFHALWQAPMSELLGVRRWHAAGVFVNTRQILEIHSSLLSFFKCLADRESTHPCGRCLPCHSMNSTCNGQPPGSHPRNTARTSAAGLRKHGLYTVHHAARGLSSCTLGPRRRPKAIRD